jgi:predicted acyl esterase
VVISPLSHGGGFNVDPFASNHTPPVPSSEEQFKMEADFFDRVLGNDKPEPVESSIQYYTMGEGRWHTTKIWPPEGLSAERLYSWGTQHPDRGGTLCAGLAIERHLATKEHTGVLDKQGRVL